MNTHVIGRLRLGIRIVYAGLWRCALFPIHQSWRWETDDLRKYSVDDEITTFLFPVRDGWKKGVAGLLRFDFLRRPSMSQGGAIALEGLCFPVWMLCEYCSVSTAGNNISVSVCVSPAVSQEKKHVSLMLAFFVKSRKCIAKSTFKAQVQLTRSCQSRSSRRPARTASCGSRFSV